MDERKITWTVLGATVLAAVCINFKFNRRTELLRDLAMKQADVLDMQYQAQIDEIFADIVDNYDE